MKTEIPSFSNVPSRVSRLVEFAYNLWWSWHAGGRALFRGLDRTLWRRTQHNPVLLLKQMTPEMFAARMEDQKLLDLYDSVLDRFDVELSSGDTWFTRTYPDLKDWQLAYLCAEFGVHGSIPIYSGGLGLLAGDTCKEASDLGIPFVGLGFLYPQGYFHQHVNAEGRQEAIYQRINTSDAPLLPVLHDDGRRFIVSVPIGIQTISVSLWKVQVGRVPLYMMDTDIPENDPSVRNLSAQLYGGDQRVRLQQEILLGMGGVRVLRALGYDPRTFHLNEGHAAFAGLELLREQIQQGKSFQEALESVRAMSVFTTHTPVQAGHDVFPPALIEEYFHDFWTQLNLTRDDFFALGSTQDRALSMTILAMRLSEKTNAVSRRHGRTSRQMWNFLWPEQEAEQVPIIAITNGVHVPTWVTRELVPLYEKYVGGDWLGKQDDLEAWQKVLEIPDRELWQAHLMLKLKLFNFLQERARQRWMEDRVSTAQVVGLSGLLSPYAFTIGFARRFATYKRATLILHDRERLKKILHNPFMPVQLIFAGKAHPADEPGKLLLQQIYEACTSPEFGGRIAFIEDYEKYVAYHLVSGVDLWLNNPRPPLEASGTSGQKAAFNGVPNFSVLDGWWFEGYNGKNGWVIDSSSEDDYAAANSLYSVLEYQIIPLFYRRDPDGIPSDWVAMMKEAMRSAFPFSARRMMKEYTTRMYLTAPMFSTSGAGA